MGPQSKLDLILYMCFSKPKDQQLIGVTRDASALFFSLFVIIIIIIIWCLCVFGVGDGHSVGLPSGSPCGPICLGVH